MRRMLAAAIMLALPALAGPAQSSTPAAMQQGLADARQACRKASGLKNAVTAGEPVLFSDTAGKTAFIVTGTWRQAHMKGRTTTMLCLYDRAARTAEAQEALGWTAK